MQQAGADKFEIVRPSLSILAEPPVSVVDRVVKKHGTAVVANAYLEYLLAGGAGDCRTEFLTG